MDWAAFETDVWETINDGLFTDQAGTMDETGIVVTIGETWQGALFGAEENEYGQRTVYLFDTFEQQAAWFDAVTTDLGPANLY